MRTYELRKGHNREAEIRRLGRGDHQLTLTRTGRTVRESRVVAGGSLQNARKLAMEFIRGETGR